MKDRKNSKRGLHRRDMLKGTAAAGFGLSSGILGLPKTFGQTSEGKNRIQLENAKPGTRGWMLTKRTLPHQYFYKL